MSTRRTPPPGELPQRQLALELRYAIDVAQKTNSEPAYAKVAKLIASNPTNAKARHVAHNLGRRRLEWLAERPSLGSLS